jgi:hypothetical protein
VARERAKIAEVKWNTVVHAPPLAVLPERGEEEKAEGRHMFRLWFLPGVQCGEGDGVFERSGRELKRKKEK